MRAPMPSKNKQSYTFGKASLFNMIGGKTHIRKLMQQEVQGEEDGPNAVNEKQLINNGGSSHKVSKGNAGGGLLGPNNF